MTKQDTWTKEQLIDLYRYKHDENKNIKEISKSLKKSVDAINRKFKRVDWDAFLEDPDAYLSDSGAVKKWTQIEMGQLDAFLQSGKSYDYIASKLNRSYVSIERKAQTTDWQAWKAAVGENPEEELKDADELKERFISSLVALSRHDHNRLRTINEKEFLRKINFADTSIPIKFDIIKKGAEDILNSLGFGNPEMVTLGEGTYVIVGDSHGKHTKTGMFKLLNQIQKFFNPNKIIHVGHILDDDSDISWDWGKFRNLTVCAKIEELRIIQSQRNKYDFDYEIVRGGIQLGNDLLITNQDIISDYVKTPINSLDAHIFDEKVVVNCHRLELMPKCSNEGISYFASPGALCERHIITTIKQIDFKDEKTVKQAFSGGFSKYRKMQHMFNYWDQGFIVVHVTSSGEHTIIPCSIKKIGSKYVTSYFNKMITSDGVCDPENKIFVAADTHSPNHDNEVLDILEQICLDYGANSYVNVGDVHDYRSLNHHNMSKGIPAKENILEESTQVHTVLKRMSKWAKESHLIYGNHERFASDFMAKFPQFEKYLDFRFLCGVDSLGFIMTNLKDVLRIGSAKFIHGDVTMYGQPGSKVEKTSRTFGSNTFVGHIHYPSIRFGSYSVGLSGKLDQEYNEPTASTWCHGIGLCNQYHGESFLTTIPIVNFKCTIGKKTYLPKNPKNWEGKEYKISLVYEEK